MIGNMPLNTSWPRASSLNPRHRKSRVKRPDCEMPSITATSKFEFPPPWHCFPLPMHGACWKSLSGLALPWASCWSYLRNVMKSRTAAKPMTITVGAFAEYTNVKIEPRSDPGGIVNCTCVPLFTNDQSDGASAVDGALNVIPAGVFHVGRQSKETCDWSRLAAG